MADVTLSDLEKALDDLITGSFPQPLAEDEFTITMVQNKAGCNWNTAKRKIEGWVTAGIAEAVGKRRTKRGNFVDAWKLVKKEKHK